MPAGLKAVETYTIQSQIFKVHNLHCHSLVDQQDPLHSNKETSFDGMYQVQLIMPHQRKSNQVVEHLYTNLTELNLIDNITLLTKWA